MNDLTWQVELACRHRITFRTSPPMLGEQIWCFRCAAMSRVVRAPMEFRIRCRTCTFSRSFGGSRQDAETAARRHRAKHPTHKVDVKNGRTLIYTLGADDDTRQGVLWPNADHPPIDPPF